MTVNVESIKLVCYFLATFFIIFIFNRLWTKSKHKLPPGPSSWPIIGDVALVFRAKNYIELASPDMRARYGDVIMLYSGTQPTVVVNDYNLAYEALVSKFPNELSGRPFMAGFDIFSEGSQDILMANPSPRWRLHRKIGHSALRKFALQSDRMESLVGASFNVIREAFGKRTSDEIKTKPICPRELMNLYTFNVICCTVYGKVYKTFDDTEFKWLLETLINLSQAIDKYFFLDFMPILYKLPTPGLLKLHSSAKELANFMQNHIEEHRRTLEPEKLRDITDFIINERNQYIADQEDDAKVESLQDVHIRQTMFDIFLAGTVTSTTTLEWMIGLLATHPQIQKKLHAELDSFKSSTEVSANTFNNSDEEIPRISWRSSLPYTWATLLEVMRYSAVAPKAFPHKALKDCRIGEYDIPQGTDVILNIYAFHFDPKYWGDDVNTFKPERFLVMNPDTKRLECVSKLPGFAPFRFGRRVCLGDNVAKNSLFLSVVWLCREYEFKWTENETLQEADTNNFDRYIKPFNVLVIPRRK